MGRPSIGKRPMTDAERQRRRRKRLKKAEKTEQQKATAARARYEREKAYMPMPPGIYYWKTVRVRDEDGKIVEISRPHRKPLAACHPHLDDDDVLALLDQLHGEARDRGLDLTHLPAYPDQMREMKPGEGVTVSALPRASRKGSTLDLLAKKDR